MPGFPIPARSRRHPERMWVVGLFAMPLHLLAGSGSVRAGMSSADKFIPDACGSHGMFSRGATPGEPASAPSGGHDCCLLCAAGAPPMASALAIAVTLAPTLRTRHVQALPVVPRSLFAAAHRPRGPPVEA